MTKQISPQKHKDIQKAIKAGVRGTDIREMLNTSAGTITKVKREMGLPIRPMKSKQTQVKAPMIAYHPAGYSPPTTPLSPEEYVSAFEARVIEYHTMLRQKDIEIEQLKQENRQLRADYQQIVFQTANWTGPTSLIGKSLGNGG